MIIQYVYKSFIHYNSIDALVYDGVKNLQQQIENILR
jgi:hypothetical protein